MNTFQIPIKADSQLARNPPQLMDGDVSYSSVTTGGLSSNQDILKWPIYQKNENTGNVWPVNLLQTAAKENIQFTQSPINGKASYSSVISRGQKMNQEFLKSSPTYSENTKNTEKVSPVELANTLRDGYNFWSQVPTLTEHSKPNSSFMESQSTSIPQNWNCLPKWCDERCHLNEPNSESLPFSFGQDHYKPYDLSNIYSPLSNRQSLNRNPYLQSETILTAEDEVNLCNKFSDLALDEKLGSKEQLDESGFKFKSSSKDKNRRKTYAFESFSPDCPNELNAHSEKDLREIWRRSYSDVTRGDNNLKNGKYMAEKVDLDGFKTVTRKRSKRYSDAKQMSMCQFDEINNDETNKNEIQTTQVKDVSFHIKSGEVQTNSFGDNLLTGAYLKQLMCKESKTPYENSNNLSEHMPVIHSSLNDFERKCLEELFRPPPMKDIQIDKMVEECRFEAGEVTFNQGRTQTIQQEDKLNFCGQLHGYEGSFTHTKNRNIVPTNTEWKDAGKSICLVNSIHRKKKSKKIPSRSVRQRGFFRDNVAICPITLKLNLEVLKRNASIFQRSVYHEYYSGNFQPEIKTTTSLIPYGRDFKKALSLRNDILSKHTASSTSYAIETKSSNSTSENRQEHLNNIEFVGFLNNLLQFATLKNPKSSDDLPKKLQNHMHNPNHEHKGQESKENALIKRRISYFEASLSNEQNKNKEPQPKFFDTGFVVSFVNCQTDSKWFPILKGLHSCVPLSQHLLPPTNISKCSQATHLRSIHSKVGKIVFSMKLEHTLREG